jgi:transposase-like protein
MEDTNTEQTKRKPGEKATARDKQRALKLYVHWNMDKGDIAKKLNVSPQTISDWAKKYEWDDVKNAANVSPVMIHKQLHMEGARVLAGEKTTVNLDDLGKIVNMMVKVRPEICIENASPVLLDFLEKVVESGEWNPKGLAKLQDSMNKYVLSIM